MSKVPLENSHFLSEDASLQLAKVCEWEGFESIDKLLEHFIVSSVVPGFCTSCWTPGSNVEPDQNEGWCANCEHESVESILIIAGLC
jgi:hypothetical protein